MSAQTAGNREFYRSEELKRGTVSAKTGSKFWQYIPLAIPNSNLHFAFTRTTRIGLRQALFSVGLFVNISCPLTSNEDDECGFIQGCNGMPNAGV